MDGMELCEIATGDTAGLTAIGRLRVEVWTGEGTLAPEMRATGVWLDEFDAESRHWVVKEASTGRLLACARLSVHEQAAESPDGYIWLDAGRPLAEPVGNIAKLVVHVDGRRLGIASRLNALRIEAARAMGARSLTVTASAANARLLVASGFVDTGLTVVFDNRPEVVFHALEMEL